MSSEQNIVCRLQIWQSATTSLTQLTSKHNCVCAHTRVCVASKMVTISDIIQTLGARAPCAPIDLPLYQKHIVS